MTDAASMFIETMEARYACKRFDPAQRVADADRSLILEAGRLSPSSFGLEPWLFAVADETALKARLFDICFGQENLRTADFVVAVAVRTAKHYRPDAEFVRARAERFPGGLAEFLGEYRGHWEFLVASGAVETWARSQGYIVCANMMNAAAALGVDSCAIEGYKESEALSLFALDPADFRISLLIPFGYRDEAVRPKIRESLDALVAGVESDGLTGRTRHVKFDGRSNR